VSCVGGGNDVLHSAAPEKAPQSNNIFAQSTLFFAQSTWKSAAGAVRKTEEPLKNIYYSMSYALSAGQLCVYGALQYIRCAAI
jgi:hypothetical protein